MSIVDSLILLQERLDEGEQNLKEQTMETQQKLEVFNTTDGPTKEIKDRLSVVETIYFQPLSTGDQPYSSEHKFFRELETSDEQVYERKIKVDEDWKPLDLGWVENVGMIHVISLEGRFSQLQPTDEQRTEAAKKVVELAFDGEGGSWLIPPGESFRGYPNAPRAIYIRCLSGTARLMVRIFPG